MRLNCPACKKRITWAQRRKFVSIWSARLSPCPHCGSKVGWSKKALRTMNIGWGVFIVSCLIRVFNLTTAGYILGALALPFVIVGLATLKFEQVDSKMT